MLLPNGSTHREDMSWTGVAVYCVPSTGIFPLALYLENFACRIFPGWMCELFIICERFHLESQC